jgi:hypothetical protein
MGEAEIERPTPRSGSVPSGGTWTRVYVWGYQPPHSLFLRERGKASEQARRFAAARGWDPARGGAWAQEITVPMSWSMAMGALEPLVSGDAAVAGWGAEGGGR